jgi:hypothetical protein
LKVGFHCLETTQNTQDIEFVKRQIASVRTDVEKAIALIPSKTALVEQSR